MQGDLERVHQCSREGGEIPWAAPGKFGAIQVQEGGNIGASMLGIGFCIIIYSSFSEEPQKYCVTWSENGGGGVKP